MRLGMSYPIADDLYDTVAAMLCAPIIRPMFSRATGWMCAGKRTPEEKIPTQDHYTRATAQTVYANKLDRTLSFV